MTNQPNIGGVNISDTSGNTTIGNIDASITAGGDVVGRDKITNHITHIKARALTAAEEAEKAQQIAQQQLAQAVTAYVERIGQIAANEQDALKGGPYRGLKAYTLREAEIFFGRDEAMKGLLIGIQRGRLTILHAESGAGKSSLLQAGIQYQLIVQGHVPLYLRPYNKPPAQAIKQALLPGINGLPELAEASLRQFLHHVTAILGTQTILVIVLDQFEELFFNLTEEARQTFVGELAECLEDEALTVRWVLSLRTEFFGNLANFRPRIKNPFENDFRLNRLNLVEAKTVITEPAGQQGISFEPELVGKLLIDLHDEDNDRVSPPQIQLICSALYNVLLDQQTENSDLPSIITLQMYEEKGQARGILRGHLNRVLRRTLSPEERDAARRLLTALVSSDQRRIRRTKSDLVDTLATYLTGAMSLDDLLDQLVESRLLNVDRDDESGEGIYELAHDYLLAEIEVDPEIQAQKAAEELLERQLIDWRQFEALMQSQTLQVVTPHRAKLRLDREASEMLLRSALETDTDLPEWLETIAPDLAHDILLTSLEREEPKLRELAARYLTHYFDGEVASKLGQIALKDNNQVVRQAALKTLGTHAPDQARQVLGQNLAHPTSERRVEAVRALPPYLNTEIVTKLFSTLSQDENQAVWEAILETLATDEATPYRNEWQSLTQLKPNRLAMMDKKLRSLRVELPWLLQWQIAMARLVGYYTHQMRTQPVSWVIIQLLIVGMLYLGAAAWQGWWPFLRWEPVPGAKPYSVASLELDADKLYIGTTDYGLDSQNIRPLREGLPLGDPANPGDSASNVQAIWAIATDPMIPNSVYMYVDEKGLLHSDDAGLTWTALDSNEIPTDSPLVTLDVRDNAIFLALDRESLYFSDDGGEMWQLLNGKDGLPQEIFTAKFNPAGQPYVGGPDGLYTLINNDRSWKWEKIIEQPVLHIDFSPDSQRLYIATFILDQFDSDAGCFTSDGDQVGEMFELSQESAISALTAHPGDPNLFYVSVFDDQIYELACDGRQRELGQISTENSFVSDLIVLPEADNNYLLIQANEAGLFQRRP